MQTVPHAAPALPPHAVLPIGVQMQLRRAAINADMVSIDAITDSLARVGLVRPRTACEWMTRAEILGTLQGPRAR